MNSQIARRNTFKDDLDTTIISFMKYFVIALPEQNIIQKISETRKWSFQQGFAEEDTRIETLPHVTLSYLKDLPNNYNFSNFLKDLELVNRDIITSRIEKFGIFNEMKLKHMRKR